MRDRGRAPETGGEAVWESMVERLHSTLGRMEMALGAIDDALLWTDRRGRILWCNSAFERILGKPRIEILGRELSGFLPVRPEDPGAAGGSLAAGTGRGAPRGGPTLCEIGPPEGRMTLQLSTRSIPAGPRESDMVWVIRDVTEFRRLQRHLVQFDKMAALGRMAAVLAHELRNPLSGVIANGQLLRAELKDHPKLPGDEDFSRVAQEIVDSGKRMNAIIENLLSFSRKTSAEAAPCGLAEVLESALAACSADFDRLGIRVVKGLTAAPVVRGRRMKLEQVFQNLFSNAADAMPRGGTLTVRTKLAPLSETLLRELFFGHRRSTDPPGTMYVHLRSGELPQAVDSGSPWVLTEVADTGAGIPPDQLGRIFEPFFTTKPPGEGTGLGLMLCYQVVIDHGGLIWVRSEGVGRGACFSILLPCEAPSFVASSGPEGS